MVISYGQNFTSPISQHSAWSPVEALAMQSQSSESHLHPAPWPLQNRWCTESSLSNWCLPGWLPLSLEKDHLHHHLPIPGSTNVPHQVQNVPMSRSLVSESMSICHLPGLLRRSRIGWCYADLGVARLGSTSGGYSHTDSLDGIDGFWQIEAGKDTNKMNISGGKGKKQTDWTIPRYSQIQEKSEQFQCTLWYVIVRFQYSQ